MLLVTLGITLVVIVIHLALLKKRSARNVIELILLYVLVITIGVGSFFAGLMHVFNGPETAQRIGWPAGSPFQTELGLADMAFGLVAILCLFIRGNFWLAAIIVNSFFLIGCMVVHIYSAVGSGNEAAWNIGPNIIFIDLIMPLLLIVLYVVFRKLDDRKGKNP